MSSFDYPMDRHHSSGQQQQQQHVGQQWQPHLLQHGQSAFPSPVSPSLALNDSYAPYYHPISHQQSQQHRSSNSSQGLTLNLSGLSVTSPTNLSPINPSPLHTQSLAQGFSHAHSLSNSTVSSTLSPVTPISPSGSSGPSFQYGGPSQMHHGAHGHSHQSSLQHPYQFGIHHDQGGMGYESQTPSSHNQSMQFSPGRRGLATTGNPGNSSRSSSSSETADKSVPRKRSFSANPPAITTDGLNGNMNMNGNMLMFEQSSRRQQQPRIQMDVSAPSTYDDMDVGNYTLLGSGNVSPIDGSGLGSGSGNGEPEDDDAEGDEEEMGERDDELKPLEGVSGGMDMGGMSLLGKPAGMNNFVTKLYNMINDSASARFISWTELGTSFVVSNVGEFSRSILGSHFKHNNFSSFVRQLNMYGFHKINRTPRSQRTSTDAQTWEFSHHKFLRGRPDLLDEIKRKALEPDPTQKNRVELPGEMVLMREENSRVWRALQGEKQKVEKLATTVKTLWDIFGKAFPGNVPPFPKELLDLADAPDIYITSPTGSAPNGTFQPPPLHTTLSNQSLQSIQSMSSPGSSPTTGDFPNGMPAPGSGALTRQHSFQQISFSNSSPVSTTAQGSPGPGTISLDIFEGGDAVEGRARPKRQRTSNENLRKIMVDDGHGGGHGSSAGKRLSRARSDSAPLGFALGAGLNASWQGGTRPRSGSGIANRGLGINTRSSANVMANGNSVPTLLSIPTSHSPSR